jgi:hypothetical protein
MWIDFQLNLNSLSMCFGRAKGLNGIVRELWEKMQPAGERGEVSGSQVKRVITSKGEGDAEDRKEAAVVIGRLVVNKKWISKQRIKRKKADQRIKMSEAARIGSVAY